jgi:hypothetical protein
MGGVILYPISAPGAPQAAALPALGYMSGIECDPALKRRRDFLCPACSGPGKFAVASLGLEIGETSVSKYLVRRRSPPSQTWRTFLENHIQSLLSLDFFTVPTIRFQILYVFLVLAHDCRRIVHFAATAHPTAEWMTQQLREAFPWDSAPRYLLRDRDRIFSDELVQQVKAMGIKQVLSAPRSPWQWAYV